MTQLKAQYSSMVALPILVDGVFLVAILLFLPGLAQGLEEPSGLNALLLSLFYGLFCLGVYLIRKLEPQEENSHWQPPAIFLTPKVRAALAFIFGLLMMTTVAYQIGYFESIQSISTATLDEGDSSALLVYMPGALLGFSMLYILILAFPVRAAISAESVKFPIFAFLGLLLTNSMLFFSSAQAKALASALGLSDGLGVYVVSFFVLLLSFAPPRLLYQDKLPFPYGLITFLLLLFVSAWQIAA